MGKMLYLLISLGVALSTYKHMPSAEGFSPNAQAAGKMASSGLIGCTWPVWLAYSVSEDLIVPKPVKDKKGPH